MENNNLSDKIEKFLDNKLEPEEADQFAKEIEQTPELKLEVLKHKLVNRGVEMILENRIGRELEEVKKQIRKKKPFSLKRFLGIAAAVAAGLMLLSYFGLKWYTQNSFSTEAIQEIVIANNITHDDYITGRYLTLSGSDTIQTSINYIENGNVNEAISMLAAIGEGHPRYYDAKLILGLAQLKAGNYQAARDALEEITGRKEPDINEFLLADAKWLYIVTYFAEGKIDSPDLGDRLKEIQRNPKYQGRAKSLENKLNSPLRRWFKD